MRPGSGFRLWMLAAVGALVWFVLELAPRLRFETNLLALLPASEADPLADRALDRFAEQLGRNAVYLIGASDFEHARQAAGRFAARLRGSPAFSAVRFEIDADQLQRFASDYTPYRQGLLSPRDRALLAAGDEASVFAQARQALYTPAAFLRRSTPAEDPLNLFGDFLASATPPLGRLSLRDGVLASDSGESGQATEVLVAATLADSPYATGEQRAAMSVLDQATTEAQAAGASVAGSGLIGHAVAAARIAQHETLLFGGLQLLVLSATLLWVFRSPRMVLLSAGTLALGVVTALTVCHYVFGRLHVMTLVFCSNLAGIAIDYSIYYCADQFRNPGHWHPADARRHVGPALTISCLAALLSYALLAVAPFPGLRQTALFCCVGLATAYLTVIWAFPLLARPGPAAHVQKIAQRFDRLLQLRERWSGRRVRVLILPFAAIIGGGLVQLTFVDDVRALQPDTPALMQQEKHVRQLLGTVPDSRFLLVRAESEQALLQANERLAERLDTLADAHRLGGYASVSQALPSIQRQLADRQLLRDRVYSADAWLPAFLRELGFSELAIAQRLQAFSPSSAPLTPDHWLTTSAADAYRHLWLGALGEAQYASILTLIDVRDPVALQAAVSDLPGVRLVDRVAEVSRVLQRYRRVALWIVAASVLAAGLLFGLRFGAARGARLMLAPAAATLATFAVYGWLGVPVGFFHVIALHLVFGLSIEYSSLLGLAELRGPASLLSVLLAAALAILAFGLLAASRVPFIHSLGLTVAIGVCWGVVFAWLAGVPEVQSKES